MKESCPYWLNFIRTSKKIICLKFIFVFGVLTTVTKAYHLEICDGNYNYKRLFVRYITGVLKISILGALLDKQILERVKILVYAGYLQFSRDIVLMNLISYLDIRFDLFFYRKYNEKRFHYLLFNSRKIIIIFSLRYPKFNNGCLYISIIRIKTSQ